MGKRAGKHRFLPDVYVFPGGRLDPQDRQVAPLHPLRAEVAASLAPHCPHGLAQALAIAAIRETFEETGLILGTIGPQGLQPDLSRLDYLARAITPSASPIRFHARFFLAAAEDAGGRLQDSSELTDLRWVGIEAALRLPLADVTEFLLEELGRRLGRKAADAPALWSYRRGIARVRRET